MKIYHIATIMLYCLLTACGSSEERSYQGYIEGDNTYIALPYSGTLDNLAVARGDHVKKGQLLFQLDKNPQLETVDQAAMALMQAQNTLHDLQNPRRNEEIIAIKAKIAQVDAAITLAELRVKRNRKLYGTLAVDKDSLDASIALLEEKRQLKVQYMADLQLARQGSRNQQIEAQKAQVSQRQAKLEEVQWMLGMKKAISPAAGIIFDTYYRQGEFVPAQQAVLSLLTPANVYLVFFVPVQELAHLKVGSTIDFTCPDCNRMYTATISFIASEAEFAPPLIYSRQNYDKLVFRIEAALSDFGTFKPGQPVTVKLK